MVLGEVNSQEEIATIVKGGKGASPLNDYRAEEGQILSVNLDLKLIADVGLIGFLTFIPYISSARFLFLVMSLVS